MTLYILKNKSHFNENYIFLDWQKKSISKVSLEPIARFQYMTSLNLLDKLVYYPNIS